MPYKPSFIIIGAMKSATTTLYDQLNNQDGIFLPELKEPNYYSDDHIYAKGLEWYESLFTDAKQSDIIGEASTHYTKLPTYPDTISRLTKHNPEAKLIYILRHPIDRLISQYVHEWSQNNIKLDINEAIYKHPELINYSKYFFQLEPFLQHFKKKDIMIMFFESIIVNSQKELERACEFIGYHGQPKWIEVNSQMNKSSERVRKFPLYDLLVDSAVATWIRRNLIPQSFRDKVKSNFQMTEKPKLTEENIKMLKKVLNDDLESVGRYLSIDNLNCDSYKERILSL